MPSRTRLRYSNVSAKSIGSIPQNRNGEKFLEPHPQTEDSPSSRAVLESQLRECFGRVVYSHKTHEKCADILLSRLSRIKLLQIILSALTAGGFIAAVFGAGQVAALLGIVISTVLLVLNSYTKNYDLGELAQKHRQAGVDLWIIREKYLSLITDLRMGEKPFETLQAERDALLKEFHAVYSGAPSTTYQAYKKAQEALKNFGDMTFSDEEIDAFHPKELKKG
jgi:conflict system pore-forming effector with SLATT domain